MITSDDHYNDDYSDAYSDDYRWYKRLADYTLVMRDHSEGGSIITGLASTNHQKKFWETNLLVSAWKGQTCSNNFHWGQNPRITSGGVNVNFGIWYFLWWYKPKLAQALYIRLWPRAPIRLSLGPESRYYSDASSIHSAWVAIPSSTLSSSTSSVLSSSSPSTPCLLHHHYLFIFPIICLVIFFTIIYLVIFTIIYLVIFNIIYLVIPSNALLDVWLIDTHYHHNHPHHHLLHCSVSDHPNYTGDALAIKGVGAPIKNM